MAVSIAPEPLRTINLAGITVFVKHHHLMKTFLVSAISCLVGLAIGCYIGYRYNERYVTNEAIQAMMEGSESSAAASASISARSIGLIDSGDSEQAIQLLSFPVGHYYLHYVTNAYTNQQRLKMRALIDQLAQTNKIVAAHIATTTSNAFKPRGRAVTNTGP